MSKETKKSLLSPAWREHMDKWLQRYPADQKRSGVFEALRLAQEENNNYLSTDIMDEVAAFLDLAPIAVYEVATFYTMYNLKPVGKHVIEVCTNISCMVNGAEDILSHLKETLGLGLNENSKDGKFTIREVECLGACVNAPVCQIGKHYHENLSTEKVDQIVEGLKNGK